MNEYNIGDLVELTATFQNQTPANVNPSTVVITVYDPAGNLTTPAVTNPSTGVFTSSVSVGISGVWKWRAVGTGAAQAAQDGSFYVQPNTF